MDTNTNTTEANQVEIIEQKNAVGRPRSVKKNLFLSPTDFSPRKKGRISHGSQWKIVSVDRALNAKDYVHGTTKTYGEMTDYTVPTPEKALANTVQVHIVPAQEIAAEDSTETQNQHKAILAQPPALA